MPAPLRQALRGQLLTFRDDPHTAGTAAHCHLEDGMLVIEDGRIAALGDSHELLPTLPAGTPIAHYPDCLILPGLIDSHIHLPQTQVIASYGAQLLDWLQTYTFVEEQRFADPAHSARIARFFLGKNCFAKLKLRLSHNHAPQPEGISGGSMTKDGQPNVAKMAMKFS
jgi:guanine deaminase